MRGEGGWSDQSKKSKNFCSACAGFGVFSFCAREAGKFRREAGKFPLHESTDSSQGWTVLRSAARIYRLQSRLDRPKNAQPSEKSTWPGRRRLRPRTLWDIVRSSLDRTHQPLVAAPLLRTTSLQTFSSHGHKPWRLVAPAGRNTQIAPCFCMPSYPRPSAW